jgi:membrane protein
MERLAYEWRIVRRTVECSLEDGVVDLASSIAFFAAFALFPLLLAVIAVAGLLLDSAQVAEQLERWVVEAFPASADLLRSTIKAVVRARGPMSIAAILGLLWSGSAGFGAITRAINKIVGTSARPYPLAKLRHLLMALAATTLLIVSIGVTSASALVTSQASWLSHLGLTSDALTRFIGWATSFTILFLMFALIYRWAPTVEVTWKMVWPGALLATVMTELGKWVFLAYLNRVVHLEAVFGSLSSIMVLLLWLYVSAMALIIGAEYSVVRVEERLRRST